MSPFGWFYYCKVTYDILGYYYSSFPIMNLDLAYI